MCVCHVLNKYLLTCLMMCMVEYTNNVNHYKTHVFRTLSRFTHLPFSLITRFGSDKTFGLSQKFSYETRYLLNCSAGTPRSTSCNPPQRDSVMSERLLQYFKHRLSVNKTCKKHKKMPQFLYEKHLLIM